MEKSGQLMARWGKKYGWHHRALGLDEFTEGELQRRLLMRRARARERALAAAEMLDEKVADAIKALQVTKVVKGVDGKPDQTELQVTATDIARLFEVSQKIQHRILGKDQDEEVYEFHVHVHPDDPRYADEQPEAMAEARRKAQQEREKQQEGLMNQTL